MFGPFATLSLASTVVRFIELAHSLLSNDQTFCQANYGTLAENGELERIKADFAQQCECLGAVTPDAVSTPSALQQQKAFRELATASMEAVNGLLSLKIREPNGSWRSLRQALGATPPTKKIKGM